MSAALVIGAIVVVVVGWNYFVYKATRRPLWNPLWVAFTLTSVALLYGIGGLLGYVVPQHNPFIERPALWVGHIVWSQVSWASGIALVSLVFWRAGLKRL